MGDNRRIHKHRRSSFSSPRPVSHSPDTTPSLTDSDNSHDTDSRPARSPPTIHHIDPSPKLRFPRTRTPVQTFAVNFNGSNGHANGHANGYGSRAASPFERPYTPSSGTEYSPTPLARNRSRALSNLSFYLAIPSLPDLLTRPRILSRLLACGVGNAEFNALRRTCRKAREALSHEGETREVILERFVPGYRRRSGSMAVDERYGEIGIDMSDIELLGDSLALPLHIYPTHALHMLTLPPQMPPSPQAYHMSRRLELLAHVHSRFVLLLRSRAPRWSAQLELDDPSWLISNGGGGNVFAAVGATSAQSQNHTLWHRAPPREIVFPGPLFSLEPEPRETGPPVSSSPVGRRGSLSKLRRASLFSVPSFTLANPRTPPPPPPSATPAALRLYRNPNSARRTYASRSLDSFGPTFPGLPPFGHSPSSSQSYSQSHSRSMSRSSPSPPFATPTPPSPGSDYSPPLPPTTHYPLHQSQSWHSFPLPLITSPHDLHLSALPTRAPIIRVFVPCTTLSPSALLACEGQLFAAGLWPYLHSGDVVCNLGYIPLPSSNRPSPQSSDSAISSGSSPPGADGDDAEPQRGWLLFTGSSVVPYFPPSPPPLPVPLSLPSPNYYTHLSPAPPRFLLALPAKPMFEPTLQPSLLTLPAPHLGAQVKVQVWRARIAIPPDLLIYPSDGDGDGVTPVEPLRIGEGWAGEWVVEADGTREGLGALEDAGEGGERVWEVVRGRSRPGRVWLKLISTPPAPPSSSSKPSSRQKLPSFHNHHGP